MWVIVKDASWQDWGVKRVDHSYLSASGKWTFNPKEAKVFEKKNSANVVMNQLKNEDKAKLVVIEL